MLLVDGSTRFIYGPDGLPLEQVDGSGGVLWIHHDQLGSTRALTGPTGGVVGTSSYDAYARLTASSGTATTPLGYAGQYTDAESGLQYLRARYYDPVTAQFLTRDPMTDVTQSPYGYAHDDPVNAIDPSGLDEVKVPIPISIEDVDNPHWLEALQNSRRQAAFRRGLLRERGKSDHCDCQAHHIVPLNSQALPALKILVKSGIDPRSLENGALLDRRSHEVIHTRAYYRFINLIITEAWGDGGPEGAARVRARLAGYKESLERTYPCKDD
jgi:RHS repeat-associated protein